MSASVLDPGRPLIATHAREFDLLVDRAVRSLARGRANEAAAGVQLAGAYAWLNHTGVFASAELEMALRTLSHSLPDSTSAALTDVDVLHVATQVYETGGPTRFILRWMEQDDAHRHGLCLTQQGTSPLPSKVRDGVAAGLPLVDLTSTRNGPVERAALLRRLATTASVVVIHAHPHDVIPALAFAAVARQGVIVVNHADHVFWLGASIPGLVYNMRDSGQALALDRRGVSRERSVVMARPLALGRRMVERHAAKASLGVAPGTTLIVTVADAPKYTSIGGPSLLDMVTPLVLADETVSLLAAGPEPTGEWATAERLTNGRIRALGRLPDASLLQQAADIYLDSFPFASLTSMLEAGSFGAPLVTYRGHPAECDVLGSDTPGVDEFIVRASTAADLRIALRRLLDDQPGREALGRRTMEAIHSTHSGEGWLRSLSVLYDRSRELPERLTTIQPTDRQEGPLDEMVALVQARTPFYEGLVGAAKLALSQFPLRARSRLWTQLARRGHPVSPVLLLPAGAVATVTARRRALGIRRPQRRPRAGSAA